MSGRKGEDKEGGWRLFKAREGGGCLRLGRTVLGKNNCLRFGPEGLTGQ